MWATLLWYILYILHALKIEIILEEKKKKKEERKRKKKNSIYGTPFMNAQTKRIISL